MGSALWTLLALAYSWWATGLETFSGESTAAVLGGGAAAVVWGTWLRRRRDGRSAEPQPTQAMTGRGKLGGPSMVLWLALMAALAILQLATYTNSPREDYPTISSIINDFLGSHAARALACAAWLAGAALLARHPGRQSARGRP